MNTVVSQDRFKQWETEWTGLFTLFVIKTLKIDDSSESYMIKSLRKESKVVQTKKQYGDFSLTALSFASISIFSG